MKKSQQMKPGIKYRNKYIVLPLLLSALCFRLPASENMYLHIDRDKYIAGEYIWFSIYTTESETQKLSPVSSIAYAELINPWNKAILQSRFRLTGGRGDGAFMLPDTLSSGTYILRCYTNLMKNSLPGGCFMQEIQIFNPLSGSDFHVRSSPGDSNPGTSLSSQAYKEDLLQAVTDSIYNRRQKVTLGIKLNSMDLPGENADISISVIPSNLVPAEPLESDRVISSSNSGKFSAETGGHFLSFLVRYRGNGNADSSDFLFMSVQGKVAELRYAQADAEGRFTFFLPVDDRLRNLIIQPEYISGNMVLEMESPFSVLVPDNKCIKTEMSYKLTTLFSGLSFNYQASRIYGTDMKQSIFTSNENEKRRRFYGIPEMEILLDDYIRLPNMQEVFFELLPGIIIRERKGEYEIQITNPLTGEFYKEPPLVMIDGVIINNLSVLIDFDPGLVEKIEVIKTPYLIGDLILHGIVNIITRDGNFRNQEENDYAVVLPYRVVERPPVFTSPDYSDEVKKSSRTPDLRNTLYWNPSVRTNSRGEAEAEFWTSDLPGDYTININGISESGKKISWRKSFVVR